MAHRWRLYLPELPAVPGERVALPRDELHHARRVLRLGPGDSVWLFDGAGTEWCARLVEQDAGLAAELLTRESGAVEPPLRVVLFQGACRPDRFEWVVQKTTELGVSAVRIWSSDRADVRTPGPGKLERWRRIAVEAAKQSGRRVVPTLDRVDALPAPPSGTHARLAMPGDGLPALTDGPGAPAGEVWLAVGPESGISPDEADAAREAGWRTASLGPRILRTETAGVVAVTLALHAWGDLAGR